MLRSLRARLLVWTTGVMALAMAIFGATVCYLAWRTRLADVDDALRGRASALAAALSPTGTGTFDLVRPPAPVTAEDTDTPPYHAIWDAAGVAVDISDSDLGLAMPEAPGARTRGSAREVVILGPGGAMILTGRSITGLRAEIWALAGTMAAVGAVALLLSLAGGWWLVGRALEPVDRISGTARAMIDGDFAARVPVDRVETELEQLAHALNAAFDRLHASLDRQRRFTADASHELRTPLAIMTVELDWARARVRSADEYQQSLAACHRAAIRMRAVVERLLLLARLESEADQPRREPVALDELTRTVAADLQALAAPRGITIAVDTAPATIVGDPDRLSEALTNIVSNAVQYNIDGGRVAVRLGVDRHEAVLTVGDTGVGISADDLPRVFDPFFRADAARGRSSGGAGLGLAVARTIVHAHDGRITCDSRPGHGTTMTIHLPIRSQPASAAGASSAQVV